MKKIRVLLFTLFVYLLSISGVSAASSFKCRYDDTHAGGTTEYWITYEKNGDTLYAIGCTKNGAACDLKMDPVDWTNGGTGCPDAFNISDNKIVLTSYKDANYIHYYTWVCSYGISHDLSVFVEDSYGKKIRELDEKLNESNIIGVNLVNQCINNVSYGNGLFEFRNLDPRSSNGYNIISRSGKMCAGSYTEKVQFTINNDHIKSEKCPMLEVEEITYDLVEGKDEWEGILNFKFKSASLGWSAFFFNWNKEVIGTVGTSQCYNYLSETSCKTSLSDGNVACVWVDKDDYDFLEEGYCNVDNLLYVGCGGASDIPMQVPALISMLVNLLKIATPIILIFISIMTLIKAMSAGKEDEIKKATSSLIKKIIAAALVFFVVAIVQFVIAKVAEDDEYQGFEDCLNCFLNNSCSESTYYKTVVSGEDYCTPLSDRKTTSCKDMFK